MHLLHWSFLICLKLIFFTFQNYMIPLKQVLSPQEMEAIFVNLEVRIRRCRHRYVYTHHIGACRAFAWISQCVFRRVSEWRDTLYACMHIRGVMVCKGHSHMGGGGVADMLGCCLEMEYRLMFFNHSSASVEQKTLADVTHCVRSSTHVGRTLGQIAAQVLWM